MRPQYFDSSVILSMLLNDSLASRALSFWESASFKISSRLLCLECYVVSHRYALRLPADMRATWIKESAAWLDKVYSQIYIHEVDSTIQEVIKEEVTLGKCRSLDAIHLATCLVLSKESPQSALVTFDQKMMQSAQELGIVLAPTI